MQFRHKGRISYILAVLALCWVGLAPVQAQLKIAKLKYNGGGDWYADKTALPNLIKFCNKEMGMNLVADEDIVEVGSQDLFLYPYIYMTGHGNVTFSPAEGAKSEKLPDWRRIPAH